MAIVPCGQNLGGEVLLFYLSVQSLPLLTPVHQHHPSCGLRYHTSLCFSVNPSVSVWLATSYINPNFSFPTTFFKSAQIVSIFSLYCKAIFPTFLNRILLEYFDHPLSHQVFLLHLPFLYFLSDGETWAEDQLIIKEQTLEVGIRLHEGDECEQNKHEGVFEYG